MPLWLNTKCVYVYLKASVCSPAQQDVYLTKLHASFLIVGRSNYYLSTMSRKLWGKGLCKSK